MKEILEGSHAAAEAAKLCRPDVVSAYPITPQTHIVERLAEMVADGELDSEYICVESEFSALVITSYSIHYTKLYDQSGHRTFRERGRLYIPQ